MSATYDSAIDLAAALRRAEDAHGRHEAEAGIPTRTGRIGTRSTWWTSSPGSPVRPTSGAAHEQLRRHCLGRRFAGRALRRRVGRRWTASRRRGTPVGRRRVFLLGVHPFQDTAAPRGGGPRGTRSGCSQRPSRCRGGPGVSRFHSLELLRCRPGTLASRQGYRSSPRHRPAGRRGSGRSGRCTSYRGTRCRGDRLGIGRATGTGPGRPEVCRPTAR